MSLKSGLILALCLLVAIACGERVRYDNYRVYKVVASSEAELAILKNLDGTSDSLIFLDGVHLVDRDVEVVVAPHKVPDFLAIMDTNEIDYKLVERNLQSALETDDEHIAPRAAGYGWDAYYELDDTYRWLESLAKEYPGIVTLVKGGTTYERRSILGVKISYGQKTKPAIVIESGIHAREWITPATTTYMINELLTSKNAEVRNIAENYDWHIFPHTNPDGYVYTHKTDRMWRKTRKPYGQCFGADANRNWAYHWNEVGSSNNPCSDIYAGSESASEIETRTFSEYLKSIPNKRLYISLHAYSQYVLYPHGYTAELPANNEDYKKVYAVTLAAINKRYGTKYTGGNIYSAIYPASGSTIDYAYGVLGTKMAFCFELRPSSNNGVVGFRLPASQIKPTGEETLDGVVAMIKEVGNLGYFKL